MIAYNPNATQDPFSNQVVNVTSSGRGKDLSIGLGTDALAILYDVSGTGNPNTYGTDGNSKLKDIRGLNVSIKVGADILNLGSNYSAVDCSYSTSPDFKYCGSMPSSKRNDYWAGAQKACDQQGMRVPTIDELKALYNDSTWADKPTSVYFWSSEETSNSRLANVVNFTGTSAPAALCDKDYDAISVLCIGK